MLTVATIFVGTPSLKITHATGVVTHLFPAMLLLPPVLFGFLAARAAAPDQGSSPPLPSSPLVPFVVVLVVLHCLGLVWAPHTPFAVGQVGTLLFNAVLFFTVTATVTTEKRLEVLLATMAASAVAVCATMVCGAYFDWAATLHLGRGVELNFELFSEERWGRIGGLCSANQAGGYLVLTAFLAAGLAMTRKRLTRVGLILLALVCVTFVVVSGSRGAILGLGGAASLFLLLNAHSRRRLISRSTLLVLVLAAAILAGKPSFIDRMLVGFGYSGPLLFTEKKNSSDSTSNVSGSGARFRMWKDALGVMADQPELMLLGLGPGGFIWHTREPEVHSLWLAFFFDLGLLGGLTGLLGLATLAAAAREAVIKTPPGPGRVLFLATLTGCTAELGIHSLIDHDLTSPVSRFAWLYVAILAAALRVVRQPATLFPKPWEAAHEAPAPHPARRLLPAVAYGPGPNRLPGPARPGDPGLPGPGVGRA
jgi:O-antigen ligase